jgi:hypothetical protein
LTETETLTRVKSSSNLTIIDESMQKLQPVVSILGNITRQQLMEKAIRLLKEKTVNQEKQLALKDLLVIKHKTTGEQLLN